MNIRTRSRVPDIYGTAEEIFHSVKSELYCANHFMKPNDSTALQNPEMDHFEPDRVVKFMRTIVKLIFPKADSCPFDPSKPIIKICIYLLSATLASVYKTGRCDEYMARGLIRFLKKGISNSIELIAVHRSSSTHSFDYSHVFIVLNRCPDSKIHQLETWKEFIKFDPWGDDHVMLRNDDQLKTLEDLGAGAITNIHTITQSFSLNRNLTSKDCGQLVSALKTMKELLTPELLLKAHQSCLRTSIDIKTELRSIHEKIDEEIICFENLRKSPPLSPAKRLTAAGKPSLFQRLKQNNHVPNNDVKYQNKVLPHSVPSISLFSSEESGYKRALARTFFLSSFSG